MLSIRRRISLSGITSTTLSTGSRRAASSGARETAAGRGRIGLVEAGHAGVFGFLALRLGLQGRHSLRSHLVRVLFLDALEPLGALGRLRLVDVDAADLQRLVDLREQLVHELVLRNLPQRLAVSKDQAFVLGAGDA